ncbi:hypothetical protein ARAM_004137 [Aspergillus rambellii]|uniref:Nicotinamide riboside kinase n=1 Tax=Aspergillus rambellii TaxID=308745 RepID=A0A0F8X782_9EURO|nr:hypothetical protein ARAM_004137 [Aspergillus rambellii]
MKTLIIGLSGPSSSGKTTLARLLRRVFSPINTNENENGIPIRSFIMHEDDFYHSDDRIPYTTLATGSIIQDWDCVDAIDVDFLVSALSYARLHGSLPARLQSKEDLNEARDPGVGEETISALRERVWGSSFASLTSTAAAAAAAAAASEATAGAGARTATATTQDKTTPRERTVLAILEGFLLYSPPESEVPAHALRNVHDLIDVHLFLPAPYKLVKERREKRSGYVTIGAAPEMTELPDRCGKAGEEPRIDLDAEDDRPEQSFWTDPPGYVDDIVWPRYVRDHSWLLLGEEDGERLVTGAEDRELVGKVGQGVKMRTDAGVTIAPGQGSLPMADLLHWAVDEVLKHLQQTE